MDDMRDAWRGGDLTRRSGAIAQVDEFIAGIPGGCRLRSRDLERYRERGIDVGWRLFAGCANGAQYELHILVETAFPYTAPRVAVVDGPDVLSWPHLEKGGFLCILPEDASVSSHRPVAVVEYVLDEARQLIEDCIAGRNEDDFRREFLSYWTIAADARAPHVISLIEPQGPGRRIVFWRGRDVTIVGEEAEVVTQWLSRWTASTQVSARAFYDGALIWLPKPLLPAEYPCSAADVRALATDRSPEAMSVLEELAASNGDDGIDVLLGAESSNGTCFGAVRVCPPTKAAALEQGFRPGRTPRDRLVRRYFAGATKVTKAVVGRADHGWVHGRDRDGRQETLRWRRIAVLGVGSVGGAVARVLAQSGVGELLLVDPGTVDWANIGRHELGAAAVGRNKAVELAREIGRSLPHVAASGRVDRFGRSAIRLVEDLASFDLVVSTTGNWAADSYLNDVQHESRSYPPVLYGWVEPNAVAAHAVLITGEGVCFQCGVNDTARPHLTVADWEHGREVLQEPACGATFTPYGSVELCHATALIAECAIDALVGRVSTAVHRAWIGGRRYLESVGGAWSPEWVAEMGDPGDGGATHQRPWPTSATCLVCSGRRRVA